MNFKEIFKIFWVRLKDTSHMKNIILSTDICPLLFSSIFVKTNENCKRVITNKLEGDFYIFEQTRA